MAKEIVVSGKPCNLMKAAITPKYGSKTILTDSSWEYVSLFLMRQSTSGASDALFHWNQAHSFYLASLALPDNARPLTSYYCILNASKALLRFRLIDDEKLNKHGISSGRTLNEKTGLKDAQTIVKGAGVLPELSKQFECSMEDKEYLIFDLLYNIPCVHRAFCITFAKPEIFIPISHPIFVKKDDSKEAWFQCTVDGRYANDKSLKNMPSSFEHDIGVHDSYVIRSRKRFKWNVHVPIDERKEILKRMHKRIRHVIYYILENQNYGI